MGIGVITSFVSGWIEQPGRNGMSLSSLRVNSLAFGRDKDLALLTVLLIGVNKCLKLFSYAMFTTETFARHFLVTELSWLQLEFENLATLSLSI